jgi:hypothetical protein
VSQYIHWPFGRVQKQVAVFSYFTMFQENLSYEIWVKGKYY